MTRQTPLRAGTLIETLGHLNLMRGTPEENTGDTILLEPGEVLMVSDTQFEAKNPHSEWWHVLVIHLDAVHWRLMTLDDIAGNFKEISVRTVAIDLLDRMLDESDRRTSERAPSGDDWDEFH